MIKPELVIKRPVTYKALELNLNTWKAISELVGAGKLKDGKPEGCYLDINGNDVDVHTLPEGVMPMIGLRIPVSMVTRNRDTVKVATEGQIIVKNLTNDEILVFDKKDFIAAYQSFEDQEE